MYIILEMEDRYLLKESSSSFILCCCCISIVRLEVGVGLVVVEEEVIGQIVGLEIVRRVMEEEEVKLDVREIFGFSMLLKELSRSDIP